MELKESQKGLVGRSTANGFTLIELLIVIGLVCIVAATSLFVDIDSYRGDAFRSEQNSLGMALQTARADALNNISQKRHGVAIFPEGYEGYVIFEGNSYASRDPSKDVDTNISYKTTFDLASPTEIVFDQLSGDASYDGSITMIDSERNMTAIILINHEGKISW